MPGKSPPDVFQNFPLPAPSTSRTLQPRIFRRSRKDTRSSIAMSGDPSSQTTVDVKSSDNDSSEDEQEIQYTGSTFKSDDTRTNSGSSSAASSVSSTSLAKILNDSAAQSQWASTSSQEPIKIKRPSEPKPKPELAPDEPQFEPLSSYTCPICFGPPMNATMTPCGHICCGSCLFAAVKSTLQRGAGIHAVEANVPRCPVCRARIPGWDGKGGGVIGLKVRTMLSL